MQNPQPGDLIRIHYTPGSTGFTASCVRFFEEHGCVAQVMESTWHNDVLRAKVLSLDGKHTMYWEPDNFWVLLYDKEFTIEPFLTAVRRQRQLRRDTSNQQVARRDP